MFLLRLLNRNLRDSGSNLRDEIRRKNRRSLLASSPLAHRRFSLGFGVTTQHLLMLVVEFLAIGISSFSCLRLGFVWRNFRLGRWFLFLVVARRLRAVGEAAGLCEPCATQLHDFFLFRWVRR